MLKTLTGKFTLFFWFTFLIITLSVYLFGTFSIKEIFQSSEREKVAIMLNTLKPTIALNISFKQEKELYKILLTILKEKNIQSISIESNFYTKNIHKIKKENIQLMHYKTAIKDPFSNQKIAQIKVTYTNENILFLYNKITKLMLFLFLFALILFLGFYIFIKNELNALRDIALSLQSYSQNKKLTPIKIKHTSDEIQTISSVANEMMINLSEHVTKLKSFNYQLEQQVAEKVKELSEQERVMIHQSRQAAMGEMLESIAHQWRQPLNIIGISCANLETEYTLGILQEENFHKRMDVISENISYMSNTIDDFRNFLNPDREQSSFSPKETIADVVKILSAQLDNNNISLKIVEEQEITFVGIENEFKQVLFVLINNAKDAIKSRISDKYIEKGTIEIRLYRENEKNFISFCDNGGGIKEEILNSIFDPYFSTKFAASGTGIGLYIAKNIIESRMNGEIYVKNRDEGCCFYITQTQDKMEIK